MTANTTTPRRLEGRIALVTGGNSGIGRATARRFLDEGATVIITGRRPEAVERAAAELGEGVTGLVADAGKLDDVRSLAETIRDRFGRVDVLFLNAGIAPMGPFTDVTEQTFDELFDINVKGPFFTVQAFAPLMGEGGSIILNASVVATRAMAGAAIYSASKAAVKSLVQGIAAELAPRGIRVNALSPGPIGTPLFEKTGMESSHMDEMGRAIAAKVPLGRFGEPAEMAAAAAFLACSDASYLTGSDLRADGGMGQAI